MDSSTLRYSVTQRLHDIEHEHTSYACTARRYRPHNRPTCHAFNNNAEVIIISGTVIERPGYTVRQRQDAAAPHNTRIVWYVLSPLNILPQLTADVKRGFQPFARNACNARNTAYERSGQWHGWKLSCDMACVKLEACFGTCVACVNLAYGTVCRCSLHARTWQYGDIHRCMSTCTVSRRTSMQDATDAKIIATYRNLLRP